MTLIDSARARDIKVEIFEAVSVTALQADLEEWLEARLEETVIGLSFEVNGATSYIAYVLYTE